MGEQEKVTKEGAELRKVLPLSSLVFFGFAFMVPLTIFTTYGIATNLTHGLVSITYVVTTICMIFTAMSYCQMSTAFPVAGSTYTFVHRGMNSYVGFLGGWLVLIGYICIPMLCYVATGLYLHQAIPQVPYEVWVVLMVVIVTVINYLGIRVSDIFNRTIVWIQVIFLVALIFFIIKFLANGGGEGTFFNASSFLNLEEFNKPDMGPKIIFSGAAVLALGFLGFDAISTLSEEALNPKRDVRKAIIICCVGAGCAFIFISYMLQLAWPEAWFSLIDVEGGSYEVIAHVAGNVMAFLFTAAYMVGCLAGASASVGSASRVLFGMGRDRILPSFFASIHPRFKTPSKSILVIAAVGFLALFVSLTISTALINFGALLGFFLVNLSVISHYFIRNKQRSAKGVVLYLILPICGAVSSFAIWASIDRFSLMIGFIWLAIGVIYLAIVTKFFRKLPPEMMVE